MKKTFVFSAVIFFGWLSCKKAEPILDDCSKKTERISERVYIEQDSTSVFWRINTVKFTLITQVTHQCGSNTSLPRDICENQLYLENLTDKQISVNIIQGIYNTGTIEAQPKAKGDKSVSLQGGIFGCVDISNFQAKVIYK